MGMKAAISIILLTILVEKSRQKTCYHQVWGIVGYDMKWECVCRTWWWCSHHQWVSHPRYGFLRASKCCPGYTGWLCNTPICSPPCSHGGQCISPNVCKCPDGFAGSSCQTETCSYLKPCFPGYCTWPHTCHCSSGFTGASCTQITATHVPKISKSRSEFIRIRRSNNVELYRYIVDASMPNVTKTEYMWSNLNTYNYLNITIDAMFPTPSVELQPNYVQEYKFGITSGDATVKLTKIPRKGQSLPYTALIKNYRCANNIGSERPETRLFTCHIIEPNFHSLIEHGDNLTVTVRTSSGGYRKLKNTNTNQYYTTNSYRGQTAYKTMQLQFDFYPPYHCLENKTCHDSPLDISNEITKDPFNISWHGWKDDVSRVYMYTWQIYRLTPNKYTLNLTEENPRRPIFQKDIALENFTSFPAYKPQQPGMYSTILVVADAANNTRRVRRLVLYDNVSRITFSETSSMFIASAAKETDYRWQSTLDNPIAVNWSGHFQNVLHDSKKLLNPVDPFPTQTISDINIVLKVEPFFDDNEGKRSLKRIPNAHGIVKFDYAFQAVNGSSKQPVSPRTWITVDGTIKESQRFNSFRRDGDTFRVWIRATDIMGNQKIDATDVHFDSTPPVVQKVDLVKNINGSKYSFGSRVQFTAYDEESGIYHVTWKFVANDTEKTFQAGVLNGNKTSKTSLFLPEGKCIPPTRQCFYFHHQFDVNNCWLVVEKERLLSQVVRLELTTYNQAMVPTIYALEIVNLTTFDGMDDYSGPMNLRIDKTFSFGVRLKWDIAPSCYKRTGITVDLVDENGKPQTRHISADADWFDIVGLRSTMNYSLQFVTHYEDQRSDPVSLIFLTAAEESSPFAGLSTMAKAGIGSGVASLLNISVLIVICTVILAMILLWRSGRLNKIRESFRQRRSRSTHQGERDNTFNLNSDPPKHVIRPPSPKSFDNGTYNKSFEEDEIYLYGNMSFDGSQGWELKHQQVTLEDKVTSGRFADIYKAKLSGMKGKPTTVVAKILKSNYGDENELLMKAKINFFATQVGHHKNVLDFIGMVNDNSTLGLYMLLEFCENGNMRDWLLKQKRSVTDDVIEIFYRMSLDISKGMEYLESKKIVHRKLAARNILLNGALEAKVGGFGPMPSDSNETSRDNDMREKLPIKWLAPECMRTIKAATSKSDVWSFGIVLWEIFSCGETPYPGIHSKDVERKVTTGYKMEKPEFSSDFHYSIMCKCWQVTPTARPVFRKIRGELEQAFNEAPTDQYYYYTQK